MLFNHQLKFIRRKKMAYKEIEHSAVRDMISNLKELRDKEKDQELKFRYNEAISRLNDLAYHLQTFKY